MLNHRTIFFLIFGANTSRGGNKIDASIPNNSRGKLSGDDFVHRESIRFMTSTSIVGC